MRYYQYRTFWRLLVYLYTCILAYLHGYVWKTERSSLKSADTLPILPFATQQEWEAWLAEHHTKTTGLWLKLAKREAGIPSITYAEALESALCYGWIDGQKASFDDQFWLQKFTDAGTPPMTAKARPSFLRICSRRSTNTLRRLRSSRR